MNDAGDLESDIARVAALRGKSAGAVAQMRTRAEAQDRARRQSEKAAAIDLLFLSMPGTAADQMEVYDSLPSRSRAFLAALDKDISARRWAAALDEYGGDEAALIETVLGLFARD